LYRSKTQLVTLADLYNYSSLDKLTCHNKNPLEIPFDDEIYAFKLYVFVRSTR